MPDTPASPDLPAWEPEPLQLTDLGAVLTDTLTGWLTFGVEMLPNVVVALALLLVGWVAARVASDLARRALEQVSSQHQVNQLLTALIRAVVLGAALFGALSVMRLDGVVTSMLAGVGVVGLALGFAFQDIASNLMSGVLLATSRPFQVGDLVETASHFGTIEAVGMRVTSLRTATGELVLIPNKELTNQSLVNYTETTDRRIDLPVGVAYGDDLRTAQQAIESALCQQDYVNHDLPVQAVFVGFGSSSVDLSVRFWIRTEGQRDYISARSEAVICIKEALDAHGLHIPFPIRTLDFGAPAVGGEAMRHELRRFGTGGEEATA